MKYFLFLLIVFLPLVTEAQSTAEARRVIRSEVNSVFSRWSRSWSIDTYIEGSSTVDDITESKDANYDFIATGTATVSRSFSFAKIRIQYTAYIIKSSSGGLILDKVCYSDSSTSGSDCYNN